MIGEMIDEVAEDLETEEVLEETEEAVLETESDDSEGEFPCEGEPESESNIAGL